MYPMQQLAAAAQGVTQQAYTLLLKAAALTAPATAAGTRQKSCS